MKNKLKKDNWKTAYQLGDKREKNKLFRMLQDAFKKGEQWAKELIWEIENKP